MKWDVVGYYIVVFLIIIGFWWVLILSATKVFALELNDCEHMGSYISQDQNTFYTVIKCMTAEGEIEYRIKDKKLERVTEGYQDAQKNS